MKNLLYNYDFEKWTYPNSAPDGWTIAGVGSGAIVRATSPVKCNSYSAQLFSGATAGNYNTVRINAALALGISFWKGRTITFGGWIWCDTSGTAYLQAYDGIGSTESSKHPGDSSWRWFTITRTVDSSATEMTLFPILTYQSTERNAYFDGLVALEGGWVPQTPYAFEDVRFQLGVSTSTAITLYPEEGVEVGKTLVHNSQRASDGHLYELIFGTYNTIKIPVGFLPASEAAICNSWWENQTKVMLYVTSGPATAVYSCMLMGDTSPIQQMSKPYDDRFKGVILLEGY